MLYRSNKRFTSLHSLVLFICLFLGVSVAQAAVIQADLITDVRSTKHNLSVSGPGTLKSTTESRVCVFCHTPHGGTVNTGEDSAPLWNRSLSNASVYTEYSSPSLDAADPGKPSGSSRMCLSCHDGALVIGNVNYAYGELNKTFTMTGTDGDGTMTSGPGADTGFTRNLDTNLTNDHPISFTFDAALATADSELRDPTTSDHLGNRVQGQLKHIVPLEDGKVQCISCHDPHIPKEKFLRLNRNQKNAGPVAGSFNKDNDIICLACHEKKGWSTSAHSNSLVADETYTATASGVREFADGVQVWQAACLNCHDTHTVPGARMLLREGTDGLVSSNMKHGGIAAQEQTCYQCHSALGTSILTNVTAVPNIKGEFERAYTKPVTTAQQEGQVEEIHRITDADFMEDTANIGIGKRHAECTDCHNPHRIIKNNTFNADPTFPDGEAHHDHTAAAAPHNNIASGALAGTWGVEPIYSGASGPSSFTDNPTGFDIKKGYAGAGGSTLKSAAHVTREYQICLKCHSNFAYGVNPPSSGPSIGHNGLTQYTNQAMEFQAPLLDKGEASKLATGDAANHRSWHPVMEPTGRSVVDRGNTSFGDMSAEMFNTPWQNDGVERTGVQTMYCSDCHGSNVAFIDGDTATYTVEPEVDAAWGPHGSDKPFILKGEWDHMTPSADGVAGNAQRTADSALCFRCHNVNGYSPDPADIPANVATWLKSGFSGTNHSKSINLHIRHVLLVGSRLRCTWCHVAVPHGWRNKALLVNLWEDPEAAGLPTAPAPRAGNLQVPVNRAPYYQMAYLGANDPSGGNPRGVNWRASGEWTGSDCGGTCGGWMAVFCGSPQ